MKYFEDTIRDKYRGYNHVNNINKLKNMIDNNFTQAELYIQFFICDYETGRIEYDIGFEPSGSFQPYYNIYNKIKNNGQFNLNESALFIDRVQSSSISWTMIKAMEDFDFAVRHAEYLTFNLTHIENITDEQRESLRLLQKIIE